MLQFAILWLLACAVCLAAAEVDHPCPNACAGHGRCMSPSRQCECYDGFMGADCSLKICPFSNAWVDVAIGEDDAHNSAECSNMGICDRATGLCVCREGFEGIACERQSCPNRCNELGECNSMYYNAQTKDPGSGVIYSYETVWDAHKIYGCHCDPEYHGVDCSLRYCPKGTSIPPFFGRWRLFLVSDELFCFVRTTGDDPLTGTEDISSINPLQYNDIQRISCTADGGSFTLTFRGRTTVPIPFNAKAYELQSKLEALPTIGKGNLKIILYGPQACVDYGTTFTVEFLQNFGDLPLMVPDKRRLSLSNSQTNVVLAVAKAVAGTKEDKECSGRGLCEPGSGTCECALDFDTSNGYNRAGTRGDCGFATNLIQYCPGIIACSGHGECLGHPTYVCQCSDGWSGADCSERRCPEDLAWFSLPEGDNKAHLTHYEECSGVGLCDRGTGLCKCNVGFSGAACQRLSCPGISEANPEGCNGHGKCLDMATLATLAKVNGEQQSYTYGSTPNNPDTWDSSRIFGCLCDEEYSGFDCSLYTCPMGDDPLTRGQQDEQQILACTDSDDDGSIVLTFRDQSTSPLRPTASLHDVKQALEGLTSIEEVTVETVSSTGEDKLCTTGGNEILITFLTEHGNLPSIVSSVQNIDAFTVTTYVDGSKENLVCSGRGLCNTATGMCECFSGYGSSDGKGAAGNKRDCGFQLPIIEVQHREEEAVDAADANGNLNNGIKIKY